jgi:post-segregation antitoxin (ccd killing protein)
VGGGVMLTFDEGPHLYRWNGEPVPSVTQIIKPLSSFDHVDPDVLERARQEGVAVHKMVELACRDELDEPGLPEWLRPYLAAWRAFVAETGFVLDASEERVYHLDYRYAGTLDLRGRTRVHPRGLFDLKRSFAAGRAIGVQLAAVSTDVGATAKLLALARDDAVQAEALARAERRRLNLGTSDLLRVALREEGAADARVREVDAALRQALAHAELAAATADLPILGL